MKRDKEKVNINNIYRYRTRDLYEASAIYVLHQPPTQLEKDDKHFYWFIFEDMSVCQKISEAYWHRKTNGDFKTFADAVKDLKDRIFAQK